MKLKNKLIPLVSALGATCAVATPLVLTSCKGNETEGDFINLLRRYTPTTERHEYVEDGYTIQEANEEYANAVEANPTIYMDDFYWFKSNEMTWAQDIKKELVDQVEAKKLNIKENATYAELINIGIPEAKHAYEKLERVWDHRLYSKELSNLLMSHGIYHNVRMSDVHCEAVEDSTTDMIIPVMSYTIDFEYKYNARQSKYWNKTINMMEPAYYAGEISAKGKLTVENMPYMLVFDGTDKAESRHWLVQPCNPKILLSPDWTSKDNNWTIKYDIEGAQTISEVSSITGTYTYTITNSESYDFNSKDKTQEDIMDVDFEKAKYFLDLYGWAHSWYFYHIYYNEGDK